MTFFSSELKLLIAKNIVLFLIGINLIPEWRLFFLIATGYLFSVLTSWCIDYFINLSIAISRQQEDHTADRDRQRSIAKFLFRNETFYKIFKHLNSKSIRKEIQKILTLSSHEYDASKEVRLRSTTEQSTNSELNEVNIAVEINAFTKKLSTNFIENWYLTSVSANEQFPKESQLELEYLLNGLLFFIRTTLWRRFLCILF